MARKLSFQAIPNPGGCGKIMLTIYPPGTWMDNKDYIAFIGGSGIGHAPTLKAAKEVLRLGVERSLQRHADDAIKTLVHYTNELAKFRGQGLVPEA